jgi:uncharacterized protein (DUF433 family)
MRFQRITVNPKQMGGVPCIHGLRIPVATVVAMVKAEKLLQMAPGLDRRGDVGL